MVRTELISARRHGALDWKCDIIVDSSATGGEDLLKYAPTIQQLFVRGIFSI